ncbi:unnamed protein product [Closterium sp. Naga37s-1]|nr:unnamed protein product [Closterium sp. Naga37s-1]
MAAWSAGITADLLARALSPAGDNSAARSLGIADRRSPPSCRPSTTSPPIPTAALFSPGARDSPSVSCLVSLRPPLSRVRAISASAASSSDTDGPDLSPRPSLPDLTPRAVLDFPPAEGFGEELTKLLTMLPGKVRDVLQRHPAVHSLVEVVLDLGRRPIARFPLGDVFMCEEVVTAGDIEYCVSQVAPSLSPSPPASVPLAISLTACAFHAPPSLQAPPPPCMHVPSTSLIVSLSSLPSSLVPFSPLPSPPFPAAQVGDFGADNRAGIDRTLHRISAIRNRAGRIIGLTCRVGRAISGSAEMVRDLVAGGESVLLMGAPGVGKTTAIREIARILADECARRVVVVDTSNEIAGDGDIAHAAIGSARRMQVPHVELQHQVMIEAVENHMPQVVIIDEIGSELEAAAAATIAQRGVQLIATAHGRSVENLVKNPHLHTLAGGVQVGGEGCRLFQAAVEMHSRGRWTMHRSLAATVDALLSGKAPPVEVREMGQHGEVWVDGDAAIAGTADSTGRGSIGSSSSNSGGIPGGSRSSGGTGLARAGSWDEQGWQRLGSEGTMGAMGVREWDAAQPREGGSRQRERGSPARPSHAPSPSAAGRTAASPLGFASGGGSSGESSGSDTDSEGSDVSEEHVEQVVEVMGLTPLVSLTTDIAAADAVLALRSKLKGNAWLRGVAKFRHLPIYAVKANTASQVVRALRAILNLPTLASPPPSTSSFSTSPPLSSPAASLFGAAALPATAAAPATPPDQLLTLQDESSKSGDNSSGSRSRSSSTSSSSGSWEDRAGEDEGATRGVGGGSLEDEIDALEEARLAAESMMGSAAHAVDLLPRAPRILSLQLQLINDDPTILPIILIHPMSLIDSSIHPTPLSGGTHGSREHDGERSTSSGPATTGTSHPLPAAAADQRLPARLAVRWIPPHPPHPHPPPPCLCSLRACPSCHWSIRSTYGCHG